VSGYFAAANNEVTSLVARTTIQANITDNVQQVFEKLVKNKIQSVPIYSIEKQKYLGVFCVASFSCSYTLGFIDLADIIFFLLDNLKEEEIKNYVCIFLALYLLLF
jgi:predicted transcriptional regulator